MDNGIQQANRRVPDRVYGDTYGDPLDVSSCIRGGGGGLYLVY
jgi:hypothetical protein